MTRPGLFRKLGEDGISRLEEVETADPDRRRRAARAPRLGGGPADRVVAGLGAAQAPELARRSRSPYRGRRAADRRRAEARGAGRASRRTQEHHDLHRRVVAARAGHRARRARGRGGGRRGVEAERHETPIVTPLHDATAAEPFGILAIDSSPRARPADRACRPGRASVPGACRCPRRQEAARPHRDRGLRLVRRRPHGDPGETMVIPPRLVKARAMLHVVTTPEGAQVALGDRVLGDTPLMRDDLDAGHRVELTISRSGYDTVKKKIELVVGETTEVTETSRRRRATGSSSSIRLERRGRRLPQGPEDRPRAGEVAAPTGRARHAAPQEHRPQAGVEWDVT